MQLAELANHVSVWQLSLATRLVSQCNFPQIQSVYSCWGFKQGRVRLSLSPLFAKIWFRLNFYVLDLIYPHSRQARLACSLFSLMQFSLRQNQRHGFKCKWSCRNVLLGKGRHTWQCYIGYGSSCFGTWRGESMSNIKAMSKECF